MYISPVNNTTSAASRDTRDGQICVRKVFVRALGRIRACYNTHAGRACMENVVHFGLKLYLNHMLIDTGDTTLYSGKGDMIMPMQG